MLALWGCAAQAAVQPFFELDTLAYAEPVPIEDFRKDWAAPLRPGGDALLHARLESGVRMDGWTVGYVQRTDYELRGSDGAAALYHRARNRAPFAAGERFDLALDAWHLEARGLRVAREHALGPDLTIRFGASLLEGTALTDGSIRGFAASGGGNDYDFQADVDYRYSEDALFDRDVGRPYGRGWSLDAGASGRWRERLHWRVDGRDLFGRMRWEAAPATTAAATSDNKEFDANGYVRYNPVLSGREGFAEFEQRIHPRGMAEALWQADALGGGLRVRATEVHTYAGVLVRGGAAAWRWEFEALPRERVLGVGLGWRGFDLRWQADRLDADQARYLAATIAVRHAFE